METKIWYLCHSGFAVETGNFFLVFDYWKSTPRGAGLAKGVIDPEELKDRDVLVFVSHNHPDHVNQESLRWPEQYPNVRLVLSDDIPAVPGAWMLRPDQELTQPDFTVRTFPSNDEGVAFLVDIDGLRIFHAGDLNWWHWEGETEAYNLDMAKSYKTQINALGREPIDAAFIPVDPRLGKQYSWAIDYLMKTADVRHVFPMHFWEDAQLLSRLLTDPVSAGYRERIVPLTRRGQMYEFRVLNEFQRTNQAF